MALNQRLRSSRGSPRGKFTQNQRSLDVAALGPWDPAREWVKDPVPGLASAVPRGRWAEFPAEAAEAQVARVREVPATYPGRLY